jgi:gliding motility-associated-like protein
MKYQGALFFFFLLLPLLTSAQVCGLGDTLWIDPDGMHTYTIEVSGLVNNDLAHPDQGICGVELEFVHQLSQNLELWLTAPDGSAIQLIGPNTGQQTAFTFLARWDISFVPCSDTPAPDPGYSPQWNNVQPSDFVSGGRYIGSYLPFDGCLENFDSGPVNGTWTITVVNDPSPFYGGAILDFRLVFCDPRGVDCCFADAGVFARTTNSTVCEGADTLSRLPLLPFWPGRPVDTAAFNYGYVISNAQTITDFVDTLPNLRSFPPGQYQVCGFSYARDDLPLIPIPDGNLRLDSLRANLEGFFPDFCAELTPACAQILILPNPDTTFLQATRCYGQSFSIGDSTYTNSGVFTTRLQAQGGCDSIVVLELNILPEISTALNITVCAGDSVSVGNNSYSNTGSYTDTLTAANGCDSIVTLHLVVLQAQTTQLFANVCAGEFVQIGNQQFNSPGTYSVLLSSSQGCDSTVILQLDVFNPSIAIESPDTITCYQPFVTLSAASSATPNTIRYAWLNDAGLVLDTSPTLSVSQSGLYRLNIRPSNPQWLCVVTDSIRVYQNNEEPIANAGPNQVITCVNTSVTIGDTTTNTGPPFQTEWRNSTGSLLPSSNLPLLNISSADTYFLRVFNTANGCIAQDTVRVFLDTLPPPLAPAPDAQLTCTQQIITIGQPNITQGILWSWSGPCLSGDTSLPTASVSCPGIYIVQAVSTANGCLASDTIVVTIDTLRPIITAINAPIISCFNPVVTLQGNASAINQPLAYAWTGPGILSGHDSALPIVNSAGTYTLVVTNTSNGCADTASVNVTTDTISPSADAGPVARLTCVASQVSLGGPNTSLGPDFQYTWTSSGGQITSPTNAPFIIATAIGSYTLMVVNTINGCTDSASTIVFLDQQAPFVDAGPSAVLDCEVRSVLLDGSNAAQGDSISYQWSGPCLLGPDDGLTAFAECPGQYNLQLTNLSNGCTASDSVSVFLSQATALAILPDTVYINCETGVAQIDGSQSVFGVFDWQFNGAPVNIVDISPAVATPGLYVLNVNTLALNCPDSDSTMVLLDCPVVAEISGGGVLTCTQNNLTLSAVGSVVGPGYTYLWSGPSADCVATGQGTPQVQVVCPGIYRLIVTSTIVGVADTAFITIDADQEIPIADASAADTITCVVLSATLNAEGSSTGPRFAYIWTDLNGQYLGNNLQLTVSTPGNYFLEVTDTINGCSAVDVASVIQLRDPVDVNFGNGVFPCGQDSFLLRAFPNPPQSLYEYAWTGTGIRSDASLPEIWIDTLGWFTLTVLSPFTGCSVTDSILITQPVCGPCVRIAPPDTITCAISAVQLQASFCEPCPGCTIAWTALSGTVLSGSQSLSPTVTAGEFTIRVTDTVGVVTELSVIVPTNITPPIADAGPNLNITCRDTLLQLGTTMTSRGPEFTHQWHELSGIIPDAAASPEAVVRLPGTYVLRVSNLLTGCASTDTVVVGIDTLFPVASAGPDLMITCASSFVSPSGEASTLGGDISYLWTAVPPAMINGGDTTLNPIVSAAGVYTLRVTNNLNGCAASDTMQVSLSNDVPSVPFIGNQTLTCLDTAITLSLPPADTTRAYTWIRTGSSDTTSGNSIILTTPGAYRLIVTNRINGCTNTGFFSVIANTSPPLADAGAAPGVLNCSNPSLTLSGMAGPDGIGTLSVQWSALNNSPIMSPTTLFPVVSTPDTYVLHVIRSDNGCSATDSVTILFNDDYPLVQAGPDTTLSCANPDIMLQGSAQTTGATVQWQWSSVTGNIIGGAATPVVTINRPGLYYLEVTDQISGCIGRDSVLVGVDTLSPTIALVAPQGLTLSCNTDTLILDVRNTQSAGPATFSWSPLSGNGAQFQGDIVFISAVGVYQVVAVQSTNGCTDTLNIQVNADYVVPDLSLTASGVLNCINATVQLVAVSMVSPDSAGVQWLLPSGDTLTAAPMSIAVSEPGVYGLRLTSPVNGCSAQSSVVVNADRVPPVALIQPADTINCARPQVVLSSTGSSGRGVLTYVWEGPEGGLSSTDTLPFVTVNRAGLYSLILTDAVNGCRDTAFAEVTAQSNPITRLEAILTPPSCFGEADASIQISAIEGGSPPYTIRLNQGDPGSRTLFGQLEPGVYGFQIRDASGCSLDTVVVIPETPLLTVYLGEDTIIALGETIRLEAQTSRAVRNYRWWPVNIGLLPDTAVQVLTPEYEETYQVVVTDENGCTATASVNVQINKENLFYVPGAFSPNGDGINDYFDLFTGQGITLVQSLSVYDRWGNLLFMRKDFLPNDPALGWDGRFRDKEMTPGIYVVHAVLSRKDGQTIGYTGELVLLR